MKHSLEDFPSIEALEETVKELEKERDRWNTISWKPKNWSNVSWIHEPDSWMNKTINIIKKEIQNRKEFEAEITEMYKGRDFSARVLIQHILRKTGQDILGDSF